MTGADEVEAAEAGAVAVLLDAAGAVDWVAVGSVEGLSVLNTCLILSMTAMLCVVCFVLVCKGLKIYRFILYSFYKCMKKKKKQDSERSGQAS